MSLEKYYIDIIALCRYWRNKYSNNKIFQTNKFISYSKLLRSQGGQTNFQYAPTKSKNNQTTTKLKVYKNRLYFFDSTKNQSLNPTKCSFPWAPGKYPYLPKSKQTITNVSQSYKKVKFYQKYFILHARHFILFFSRDAKGNFLNILDFIIISQNRIMIERVNYKENFRAHLF